MKIKNYINGTISSTSEEVIDVINPSTGEKISEVVNSNLIDFNNTLDSSIKSQNLWSKVTPLKRSRILSKYKELIEKISKVVFQLDSKKPFHLLIPIPTHLGINQLD